MVGRLSLSVYGTRDAAQNWTGNTQSFWRVLVSGQV